MIQQRTAAKVSTPICSLLKKGRQFFFSGTVRNGYSENKALDARKRYILQGESAVNDADWLQIDKYNWISYINEGLYSHQSCTPNQPCGHVADKYYDLPFTIQSCHATNLIAQSGSLTFSFPHLILTMPEFLYLSASKPACIASACALRRFAPSQTKSQNIDASDKVHSSDLHVSPSLHEFQRCNLQNSDRDAVPDKQKKLFC